MQYTPLRALKASTVPVTGGESSVETTLFFIRLCILSISTTAMPPHQHFPRPSGPISQVQFDSHSDPLPRNHPASIFLFFTFLANISQHLCYHQSRHIFRNWGLKMMDAVGRCRPPFARTLLFHGTLPFPLPADLHSGEGHGRHWVVKRWPNNSSAARRKIGVCFFAISFPEYRC
jgi:hypothetical protein